MDAGSPRVTSIAIRKLSDGQTHSFSIHQVAEREGIILADIEHNANRLEKIMLDAFYDFIRTLGDVSSLHWNMRDINYGFAALEHRHQVLAGNPVIIRDERKYDLSRLLVNIYGNNYIKHPRLETLLDFNGIGRLQFLSGKDEAEAFENHEYVKLHQSTLRKVDVLANIAERAKRRTLKTDASWWVMHGGSLHAIADSVVHNNYVLFLFAISGSGILTALVRYLISNFHIPVPHP